MVSTFSLSVGGSAGEYGPLRAGRRFLARLAADKGGMERPTRGPTRPPTGCDRNYGLPQRFSARGRLFCVNTVSIVCAIKVRVPVRAEDGLDPLHLHCR